MIRKFAYSVFCIPLALVAMLVVTTSSSATDKNTKAQPSVAKTHDSPAAESSGGQCRAPIGGDVNRSDLRGRAAVERSLPGTWRRDLKFSDPIVRTPMSGGGTVVSPEGPAPVLNSGAGRWLDGYRPTTPQAQAEYRTWLEQKGPEGSALETQRSSEIPPYQYNLLNPGLARKVGTEPSGYVVRHNVGTSAVVHVNQLGPGGPTGPKGTPESDYVGRTGLTFEQYRQIKEHAENMEETPGAQDADQTPVSRAPSPLISAFDAIPAQGGVPPDPIMAAGLSHVVAVVNSHYQVYDKTGVAVTAVISVGGNGRSKHSLSRINQTRPPWCSNAASPTTVW